MKCKRFVSLALAAVLALCLAGCSAGKAPASSASSAAAKDYAQVLHDARPDEFNEYYTILSNDRDNAGNFAASYGYADEMDATAVASQGEMLLSMLNLTADDVTDFALSVSLMNTKSYAIAIVKPTEGKTDTVKNGMQTYLDSQRSNMQTYLPDQYEIAKAGEVTTLSTGEVVLVCCEGSDDVLSNIQTALGA